MDRKKIKIAFFTADWNRELVSVALNAVLSYIEKHDNICVHVFDCFTYALYSRENKFRYQIYQLPDLKQYDAVVVQAHEIVDTSELRRLEKRIVEAGIPGISVGAKMEGCVYIGTDDYTSAREIAEHLIRDHGARSFIYLKGAERDGGGEAETRRKGFEDVCDAYGISRDQIHYYNGNWESRQGKQAIDEWLASGRPLPDAIVSANDEMALGAMGALTDAGIQIPQDILVSGFDDIFSASLSDPRLSTISRDFTTLITTALDTMVDALAGKALPEKIYSPYKVLCSESCGCFENARQELPRIKKMFFAHSRQLERFYFHQDKLTAALFGADAVGLLEAMESNYRIFGEGKIYIYANSSYFDQFTTQEEGELHQGGYDDTFVLTACAGHSLECDAKHVYMRVAKKDLCGAPFIRDEKLAIFYPLQYQEINMGFMVLTVPPSVASMHLHESIINLFVFAMENARQRARSDKLNDTLNELYMTDQLTGLYNRFGYERVAEDLVAEIGRGGGDVHVLFLDIDDMKGINDRYGHEQGDAAIRVVSEVMNRSCRRSDFKMRYGGDEFVILTESGKADLKSRLMDNFHRVNESGKLPFHLDVSIGDYVADKSSVGSLDDLLRRADELMYEEKQRKRRAI